MNEMPVAHRGGFWHWVATIRLSRLIALLLLILVMVPLIAHQYLSAISSDLYSTDTHHSRSKLEHPEDISSLKYSDLKFRIEELKRIKASVNNELRDLESRRQKLHAEISGYNTHIEKLKNEFEKTHKDFEQLKTSIENTRVEQEELKLKNMPDIQSPHRILPSLTDFGNISPPAYPGNCKMHNCFDYSRCSLTSQFPVYMYNPSETMLTQQEHDTFIKSSMSYALNTSPHMTYDPHIACLYMVLVGDLDRSDQGEYNSTLISKKLRELRHWHGDGHNHILVNLARSTSNKAMFEGADIGRAMVAQSTFTDGHFREGFDVLLPPSISLSHGEVWDQLSPISPARRKHLMSFWGQYSSFTSSHMPGPIQKSGAQPNVLYKRTGLAGGRTLQQVNDHHLSARAVMQAGTELVELVAHENTIVQTLKQMQVSYPMDNFHFEFICGEKVLHSLAGEWAICGSKERSSALLQQSTFSLIIAPTNYSYISSVSLQTSLHEALKHGAIPVILGDSVKLPFSDLIKWDKAVVLLPKARIPELHFFIRSFGDADILELRRQGRIIYETYLGTTKSIVDTLLASIRTRLQIPAFPIREEPAPSVFNASFVPLKEEIVDPQPETEGDVLGPIEPPQASPRFMRNFSLGKQLFNIPGDPFHLYPSMPFAPVMPAEAKFMGSGYGFRPIGRGEGGAGKEFNQALGGNVPKEQFTIVMLTYEREAVLIHALQRLKGLPHLNKVVVVWNSPRSPTPELKWPEIGVNIHVVRTARNSLNNRFLPYDSIETDAVLSIDDDAHLRHDEIMFGFRVWREARDRIVGFPGRYHAWDPRYSGWLYNSNYSCELSMVLTGAAFFHKYYAYLYSYSMPQAIRDKVDEYTNCEDLAMNFLVSHITRKPPIKVTSRWTFRCPGCPKALSVEESHFQERHKCINFFVQVYGYMPLLNTQFRADSVLFKTRIPHAKQKCFKFI